MSQKEILIWRLEEDAPLEHAVFSDVRNLYDFADRGTWPESTRIWNYVPNTGSWYNNWSNPQQEYLRVNSDCFHTCTESSVPPEGRAIALLLL